MTRSVHGHPYNLQPDAYDHRDLLATLGTPRHAAVIPTSVDLRSNGLVPAVWDQGELGSCTGHGVGAAFEIDRLKQTLVPLMPSRLFIYYNERDLEGDVGEDGGAQIRDGIKVIAKQGVANESLWAYDVAQFAAKPPLAAYTDAIARKVSQYARLTTDPADWCVAIAAQKAPVFGFTVHASFESDETARTGIVPMPKSGEQVLGGHCVCAVGYEISARDTAGRPTDGRILIRNSWGASWALDGYCWMSFAFIRKYTSDVWLVDAVAA